MNSVMEPKLTELLEFEKFKRLIPQMSHEDRGVMLESLAHSHFIGRPVSSRLLVRMGKDPRPEWQRVHQMAAERSRVACEDCSEEHF